MRPSGGEETVTRGRDSAASILARYEALIRVSEALRAYHDRDTLYRSLARELSPVVRFNFLGLGLYDEQTHTVTPQVLEATGETLPPPQIAADDSIAYWVVQHQEPVVIPLVEAETRFQQAIEYMRAQGMRSACALPLKTPRRRLGILLQASREAYAYDAPDVAFLSLVANQVALAIDDALNYGALQRSLALERDRMRNLEASDQLLRALSAVLDIRQVFPQISQIAATLVPHDRLTLAFLHEDQVVVQASSDSWEPLPARLKVQHFIPERGGDGIID